MIGLDFSVLFSTVAEAIVLFMLFEIFLLRKTNRSAGYFFMGIVVLSVLIYISNYFFAFNWTNLVGAMLFSVLISFYYYHGAVIKRFMIAASGILILTICEIVVLFLMTSMLRLSTSEIVNSSYYTLQGTIFSKLLALIICNFFRLKHDLRTFDVGYSYWILFFLLFSSSICATFSLFRVSYELSYFNGLSVVSAIGLFFTTFFGLYLYERLARQSEAIRQQEQYEQQLKTELRHLDDILIKQEELKKVRHDMKNQLLVIKSYFEQGHAESGVGYVNTLVDAINETKPAVYSGNVALDAIINTKKILAENKGIEFTIDVMQAADLPMDDVDICVVFGNALDNAIEACERCKNEKRFINFFLIQKGQKLVCKISNTTPIENTSIEQSSKKDKENHGYGLVNIKESLAKYDSEPVIEQKDGVFCLGFVIYE